MNNTVIDFTGRRIGKLTVLQFLPSKRYPKSGKGYWLCKCDCGEQRILNKSRLRHPKLYSCGCAKVPHGMSKTRLYRIFKDMHSRCYDQNLKCYHNYGGRGIRVCAEWESFLAFRDWALINGYRDDLTIERKNNDGNYEPGNCRWATIKEQLNNTRRNNRITFRGDTDTITNWSRRTGLHVDTIFGRLKRQWTVDRALTEPVECQNGTVGHIYELYPRHSSARHEIRADMAAIRDALRVVAEPLLREYTRRFAKTWRGCDLSECPTAYDWFRTKGYERPETWGPKHGGGHIPTEQPMYGEIDLLRAKKQLSKAERKRLAMLESRELRTL